MIDDKRYWSYYCKSCEELNNIPNTIELEKNRKCICKKCGEDNYRFLDLEKSEV